MKTLEDFKREKPESWKLFGPANKITMALYFHDAPKGLSKKQMRERLKELEEGELERGIVFLKKYKEIRTVQKEGVSRYYLSKRIRDILKELYIID